MKKPIRVLLLINLASEFDRNIFRGLMRYSNEFGPWIFNIVPSQFARDENGEESIYAWAKDWQADAIIGRWNSSKAERLASLGIPIVFQNFTSRSSIYSNLTGDYVGTGRMAADFFIKRGYKNFAFCGLKNVIWSVERRQGYQARVREENGNFYCKEIIRQKAEINRGLSEWLEALPKPVALFCCDDNMAFQLSTICRFRGMKIPEDISLLGVDNDELLCSCSEPAISSIGLQVEQGGYETAKLVHEQILSGTRESSSIRVVPAGIVCRQSTSRHNIKDIHVGRLVDYIEGHFTEDITIADILDLVPLSRRSIELRFKKEMGTTLYQYVLDCRIERLAFLLLTTESSVSDLAYEAGFKDVLNLSRIFKKYKGCTPAQYRTRHKSDASR